jgi:hypothetical protein
MQDAKGQLFVTMRVPTKKDGTDPKAKKPTKSKAKKK